MRSTLRETAVITVAAIFLSVLYRQLFKPDFAWIRTTTNLTYTADTSRVEDFALDAISVVDSSQTPLLMTMEQAAQTQRTQSVTFIDAREAERFAAGHIAGAINISYYAPESWDAALSKFQHETLLIVYCDDDCDSARRLAEALVALGFKKIYVMDKGFESWKNAGHPIAQMKR